MKIAQKHLQTYHTIYTPDETKTSQTKTKGNLHLFTIQTSRLWGFQQKRSSGGVDL